MQKQGLDGSIVFVGSKNALVASAGRRRLLHGQGRRAAPGALPGRGGRRTRHPRQRGQPGRRDPRVARSGAAPGRRSGRPHTMCAEDQVEEFYRKRSLLKRSVLPEDIAEAVLFFASDRSAKSTGNIVNVDAGQRRARSPRVAGGDAAHGEREPSDAFRHHRSSSSPTTTRQRPRRGLAGGLRAPRARAAPARVGHRAAGGAGAGLPRRGALLGPGHRRHPLRALRRARASRATSYEKLEDCGGRPAARARRRPRCRCTSPGTRRTTRREVKAFAAERGARLRLDELEHLRGPAGPGALLQVRLPHARGRGRPARRPSRTTWSAWPSGQKLGARAHTVWIGDGGNFPGQVHFRQALDALPGQPARDLPALPDGLAALHRAQALRAGLLLDRAQRLGHELLVRVASSGRGPSRWWTSATTPPT